MSFTRSLAQGKFSAVGANGRRHVSVVGRTSEVDPAALCIKKKKRNTVGMSADRQLHVLVSVKIERDGFRQYFPLLRA